MISIICLYEQRKTYNENLGKSLLYQVDCSYEMILKKRVGNYFENLNKAIIEASNELILICNEHVYLDESFIESLTYFESLPFGVVGVRGRNIELITKGKANVIGREVFLIKKSDYLQYPFDITCKQHFLEDYCYYCKSKGYDNFVIHADVKYQAKYEDNEEIVRQLCEKYPHKYIDTMNDFYPTSLFGKIKKVIIKIKTR